MFDLKSTISVSLDEKCGVVSLTLMLLKKQLIHLMELISPDFLVFSRLIVLYVKNFVSLIVLSDERVFL